MKRYPFSNENVNDYMSMSFECHSRGHGRCLSAACDCWCHVTKAELVDRYEKRLLTVQALSQFFAIGRLEPPVDGKE